MPARRIGRRPSPRPDRADPSRALERDPGATSYIYDTLALAYLLDPAYATDVADMWVDVDVAWGPTYGRTLGYPSAPAAGHLQRARVVRRFDNDRFYRHIDLMTRPVPVRRP